MSGVLQMAGGMGSPEGYQFDDFRLDHRRGVLQRLDGTDLPLRPRSYELLLLLLERPEELLKRDELLEALWPAWP